jgi:putative ABC transport system ATP-binding protein
MLRLSDAHRAFHLPDDTSLPVLRGVSMSVGPGDCVAVLGRSGAGKSTLLSVLGLLEPIDSGAFEIDGVDPAALSDVAVSRLRGSAFGFVFQRSFLLGHLTAAENVEIPLLHQAGYEGARERRRKVREALERVGITHRSSHVPRKLSGGEQQLVAIARALVRGPRYLLADEPTGDLDPETGERTVRLLASFAMEENRGVVMVTHDTELARLFARRLLLRDGQLEELTQ